MNKGIYKFQNIQLMYSHFWQPSLLGSVSTGRRIQISVKGGFTG